RGRDSRPPGHLPRRRRQAGRRRLPARASDAGRSVRLDPASRARRAIPAMTLGGEQRMAEGAGFEPARRFITVYTLSRHAPSTARPPLQWAPKLAKRATARNETAAEHN